MGVFSKYHRFREAGEAANINNVARFGEPAYSLFTTSKVFTLHKHIDITDAQERVVYEANTKFPSIHDKTDVTDAQGNQVAHTLGRQAYHCPGVWEGMLPSSIVLRKVEEDCRGVLHERAVVAR